MLANIIAQHANAPIEEIERLLALPAQTIYNDPFYQELLAQLDVDELSASLGEARAAYSAGIDVIKEKYGLMNTVMGGHTLGNWVIGFLGTPHRLPDLIERHARIPAGVMRAALPEIVELLDAIPDNGPKWQRAIVTLTLPLIAA